MTDRPHHFVSGRCYLCRRLIAFDPARVPVVSLNRNGYPVKGVDRVESTEPLCLPCVKGVNAERRRNGLSGKWDEDASIWQPAGGFPE